jgi:hypothetical protein
VEVCGPCLCHGPARQSKLRQRGRQVRPDTSVVSASSGAPRSGTKKTQLLAAAPGWQLLERTLQLVEQMSCPCTEAGTCVCSDDAQLQATLTNISWLSAIAMSVVPSCTDVLYSGPAGDCAGCSSCC